MSRNKILLLTLFILIDLAVAFVAFLAFSPPPGKAPPATRGRNKAIPADFNSSNSSLFVDPNELENARKSSRDSFQRMGQPQPTQSITRFKYELAPEMRQSQSLVPYVLADSSCNPNGESATIPLYELKNGWNMDEAKMVASSFGITGEPTSLPVTGGFEYYFANPVTKDFLTFIPQSGMFRYHKVITSYGAQTTQTVADQIISSEVASHSIPPNISKKNSTFDSTDEIFRGEYIGNFSPYRVTDREALLNIGTDSVCTIRGAEVVNDVQVVLAKDGQVAKVISEVRTLTDALMVSRESLSDSISEYENNLPIDPIVVGVSSDATPLWGTVTIDEATLVYYDYGDIFSQKLYVPMYVTGGTAQLDSGGTARIITLFPAVSTKELIRLGLVAPDSRSLKLASFTPTPTPFPTATPKPSTTPKPTLPPGAPTSTPGPSLPPAAGCPGGMVDYHATCDDNGTPVCGEIISVHVDPWGVCQTGCISKEGTQGVTNGNPCEWFLGANGITGKLIPGNPLKLNGDFHCIINACPC